MPPLAHRAGRNQYAPIKWQYSIRRFGRDVKFLGGAGPDW